MAQEKKKLSKKEIRMGWKKKKFEGLSIDTIEGKQDFENWARKQRETTYDPEVLKAEKLSKKQNYTEVHKS